MSSSGCWTCGADDHWAWQCPVAHARNKAFREEHPYAEWGDEVASFSTKKGDRVFKEFGQRLGGGHAPVPAPGSM